MLNKRRKTVADRLKEDIAYAKKTDNARHRELLAIKVLGAADLAVEFGLITFNEWEKHIEDILKIA